MGEQSDAVAEFEDQVRARQDVGIAAAYLDDDGGLVTRQLQVAQGAVPAR